MKRFVSWLIAVAMVASILLGASSTVDAMEEEKTFDYLYDNLNMYDLLENEEITSNATLEKFSQKRDIEDYESTKDRINNGVMVKADKEAEDTVISFNQEFDFGDDKIDWVQVDALSVRKSTTTIELHLDSVETEAIGSLKTVNQNGSDDWQKQKVMCVKLDKKISGKHRLFLVLKSVGKKLETLIRSLRFVKGTLPVVNVDIDETQGTISDMNNSPNHSAECYGSMRIDVPDSFDGAYRGGETYELDYIRGRGNSTWGEVKKPYKIKLEKATDLFGMGKNKHWIMLANIFDNSLLRNRMTYYLGHEVGMEYTPECLSVDFVMNGEYLGNYLLCEQVRIGKGRIEINDIENAYEKAKEDIENIDVSGGYLLSCSPYGKEKGYAFDTEHGGRFYVESPESEFDTNIDERDENSSGKLIYDKANKYITDYTNKVDEAIYGENFKAKDGTPYEELLDVKSAIKYFWFQEFSKNGDAYITTSTYLYKKPDEKDEDGDVIKKGKLHWGPLWDFDYVAWAATEYGDYDENICSYEGFNVENHGWFGKLFENKEFVRQTVNYWKNTFKPTLEEAIKDGGQLDSYKEEMKVSAKNNFDRYGFKDFAGHDYYYSEYADNYVEESGEKNEYSFENEVERLKSWIRHRIDWVDANIDKLEPRMVTVKFVLDNEVVKEQKMYLNRLVGELPEAEKNKGDQFFTGWQTESICIDEDNHEYKDTIDVDAETELDTSMLNKDGEIIISGKYKPLDEIRKVNQVFFMKSDYYFRYYGNYYESYNDDYNIGIITEPVKYDKGTIEWSSSNENVAKMTDSGTVSVRGCGVATITAKTIDGKKFSTNIHVIDPEKLTEEEYEQKYAFKDFTIDKQSVTMKPGELSQLRIKTNPVKAFDYMNITDAYKWVTSNKEVVRVNNGVVQAISEGTAMIVVYNTYEDIVRVCEVTVRDEVVPTVTPEPTINPQPTPVVTPAPNKKESVVVTAPKKVKIKSFKKKNKKAVLKWLKLKKVKGYQVQLCGDVKFKKVKNKITKKNKISFVIKNKKCFVRVRGYILSGKNKLYGKWSDIKSVK